MRRKTVMQVYDGCTSDGVEVNRTIDHEKKGETVVEYHGNHALRFCFNPDFPGDARAFFEALCNVRGVMVDE
jgi:hypothetical protein